MDGGGKVCTCRECPDPPECVSDHHIEILQLGSKEPGRCCPDYGCFPDAGGDYAGDEVLKCNCCVEM